MSGREKFRLRILQKLTPKDIMPDELTPFLQYEGFELKHVKGDHFIYKHPLLNHHTNIVMKRPIKSAYIRNLRDDLLEIEEIKNEKL